MALLQDLLLLWFSYVCKQSYHLSMMVAYTGKYQTIVIDFAASENAALSLFNFHNEYWAIMYKTVTNISKNNSTYFANLFAHDSPPVLYILLIKTGRI